MDVSEKSRRPLVPGYLYSSSVSRPLGLERMISGSSRVSKAGNGGASMGSFVAQSPSEPGKIGLYSPMYYAVSAVAGIASCGPTHTAVTPLDLVKCNMQVSPNTCSFIDPAKYKSITSGFGVLLKEQGVRGFFRGWVPTLLGYSAQGACKYGFYEFFKKYYSDIAGPEYAAKYKTLIYLAGSASAEVIADVALCPFEAVKVRVQTQPGFARGLSDGLPKFVRSEGALGLYKGLVPLWGRQIPCNYLLSSSATVTALFFSLNRDPLLLLRNYRLPPTLASTTALSSSSNNPWSRTTAMTLSNRALICHRSRLHLVAAASLPSDRRLQPTIALVAIILYSSSPFFFLRSSPNPQSSIDFSSRDLCFPTKTEHRCRTYRQRCSRSRIQRFRSLSTPASTSQQQLDRLSSLVQIPLCIYVLCLCPRQELLCRELIFLHPLPVTAAALVGHNRGLLHQSISNLATFCRSALDSA
ncbi:hypothetical protein B296_00021064 [Ensete ventricosum]|uniref:Uncharacterized protein n=1 Tax=Ensete ventricosum TaxID=4639 RepID=A0A427AU34_ENSVE|nr:hypothetical protein B296_00021064 [Ensete ventricosum]